MNLEQHALWLADNGEAKRYEYKLDESSFVIDAGGYKGDWSAKIYDKYKCSILVFEPVQSFYQGIKNRFDGNENIDIVNAAIGGSRRDDYISLDGDAASVEVMNAQSIFDGVGSEQIKVLDVFESFKINEIESVDLMKINIEGMEYELLERMIETGMIGMVNNFQIQFHDFVPNCQQRRNAIREQLKKTHKCDWCYEFVWENWSKI